MDSRKPSKPFTIAIVGGGIGGLSLAISLASQNIPFHIYESASSFGEIGAGVTFGPNVIRAIRGISPAMLRAYAKHVTTNESTDLADAFLTYRKGDRSDLTTEAEYRGWTPERLFDLNGTTQEIDDLQFPVRCCVHRARFLDEIVRLIPAGTASFSKALVKIEEHGEGGDLKLHFSDGSIATASAVVGCDGIKSVTRKHLHGAGAGPEYSGFFGYRAMAPKAEFERLLGQELATTGNLFLCPNGYTITYPVDHGAALNMFATCVQPESTWKDKEWKLKSNKEELSRDLLGWHPCLLELLLEHGNGEKWAMFHSPHDQAYYRDKVCLLGDAAHATTPHMGSGAGMAIEDAFILGRLLEAVTKSADLVRAFKAFDIVRRQRTQEVVKQSKSNVARFIAISEADGEDLVRLKEQQHVEFGRIWNFSLDKSLECAISALRDGQEPI